MPYFHVMEFQFLKPVHILLLFREFNKQVQNYKMFL